MHCVMFRPIQINDIICLVRKQIVSEDELNAMVANSLKDIPSDAEVSDVDDAEVEV